MKNLFGGALAAAAALVFGPVFVGNGTADAQNVTMRISHQVPTAHHLHKMLEGFATDVQKNSNGSVTVQLFPAE